MDQNNELNEEQYLSELIKKIKSKNALGIQMSLSETDLKIIEKYKSVKPEL